MKPRETTDGDLAYWAEYDPKPVIIGGPPSEPDCTPCPALVTLSPHGTAVRVAYEMTDEERAAIADGGTLWLSTWGGLPIHMIEVIK